MPYPTLRLTVFTTLLATAVYFPIYSLQAAETTTPTEASTSNTTHRLVIQMNKKDKALQEEVISNIVNLQKLYGLDNIEIEVIAYGPGIWFVTEQSDFTKRIQSLLLQNVTFTACTNTLDTIEAKSGKRPKLLEGIGSTQAGVARLIELQEKGWSYLSP